MKKYRSLLLLSLFLLLAILPNAVNAHNNTEVIKEHLLQNIYAIDSDASAIVINEKTTVHIVESYNRWVQVTRTYKMIKILKSSAIDYADIKVEDLSDQSSVDKIEGRTYNLKNGEVVTEELSRSSIYKRRSTAWYSEVTFALPNVKEGSVIEYAYEVTEPLRYQLPAWEIQAEYPKLHSQYEMVVPQSFDYVAVTQGGISFKDCKKPHGDEPVNEPSYHIATNAVASNNYSVLWGQRDIPSISEEPYISCLENDTRRMDIQLSRINIGNGLYDEKILNNWEMLDKKLWKEEGFGKKVTTSTNLTEKITDSIIARETTPIDKAKAIFSFLRNFNCDNKYAHVSDASFNKVLESRKGTVADINLLLTSMLRYANVTASPVVLSKLGTLRSHKIYPIINRLNYVVCRVTIDSVNYYLDASDKFNPFGVLPLYCYNGYARVIDKVGEGIYLTGDDIKEKSVIILNVKGIGDSTEYIEVSEKMGIFTSANFRREIQKDSSFLNTYIQQRQKGFTGKDEITDIKYLNIEKPDANVIVKYTLKSTNTDKRKHNTIYVNTDFIRLYKTNPFIATNRKLPVEFPYKTDFMYAMNIWLPDTYTVEDIPKPAIISFENDEMLFRHTIKYDSTMKLLSVNTSFNMNKTAFGVEDYQTLRTFFEKMIQEQNLMVTIQKKKD